MLHPIGILRLAGCLLLLASVAPAQEKLRVNLSVSKKTIEQPVRKFNSGEERGRMQTLVVSVENNSTRELPEGTIRWSALVRKTYGSSYRYSGTATVKPLRSFQSAEVQCGAFDIDTRTGYGSVERDRIDYDVTLLHNEKETTRVASVSKFSLLAEKAHPASREDDMEMRRRAAESKPAALPPPTTEKVMPEKPAVPAPETTRSVAELPPVPQGNFDFFNLAGKKTPEAK